MPRGASPAALAPAYDFMSGTSMAAPAVAGLAALTWSMNPNLTAAQVKDCILAGAQTRGLPVGEVFNAAFGPHLFYSVDAFETLRACGGIPGQPPPPPQPPVQPVPPWKQPAVIECIERWLRMQVDELNRQKPGLAPWWVDQWGHLRNKAVIDARAPDDWISRWEGDRYKRIWYEWRPVPGLPPLQTYCGGLVDTTPQPVAPPPAPAPGSEPWKDANVITCINNWMQTMQSCADRQWPGLAPHRWTQYGLLVGRNVIGQQAPNGWGDRYEGNKYKWIWLEYDARMACPGVPSVQDTCSGAIGGGGVAPGALNASRFFSIDNSGSMSGQKIEEAKRAALSTVANLPAGTEAQLTQSLQQAAAQPAALKGDADGDGRCTEVDALLAIQMAAGILPPDVARMDVTGDGMVSELDALLILQWAAAGGACGP